MAPSPLTQEKLSEILSASTSPLETLIKLEGEVNLRFSNAHIASDTEFLSTYYSSYLIALLLEDDIHEARMLLRRVPISLIETDTVVRVLPKLVQVVWARDHTAVYNLLKTSPWPKVTEPLVQSYEAHYRNQVIDDTSLSYESIRLPTIESKLGLEGDSDAMQDTGDDVPSQLIQDLSAKGWTYDAVSKLAYPATPATHVQADARIKLGQITTVVGNHGSG
ncbi:uncharacterized protein GIQ15_04871 [Arthroderma uncinatum]|uniref:uncharacterized protein n=1 Tax=Arthroderma uncinatum TaxID=74035 RepID=UPI00144A6A90|nr:uncharacterized protein GIQ15_04871 [Arthroderma uncinatum]KAF3482112.1 hypothetical protein GIQ15_04871 [Arthroderma uncinatum]